MKALLKVLVDRCAQACARRRTGDIYLRTADMCVEGVEVDGDKNIRARLVRLRTDAGKVVRLTDQDIMARLPQGRADAVPARRAKSHSRKFSSLFTAPLSRRIS